MTAPKSFQPKLHVLIACLAVLGLADSIYLTVTHLTGEDVTCIASSGCSEVLSSSYATVGGSIPLAAFGVLAYFSAFSLAILVAFGYVRALILLRLLVIGMFVMTVWLFCVQAFILHAFCTYCLLSAALTTTISIIVLVGYFMGKKQPTTIVEARADRS